VKGFSGVLTRIPGSASLSSKLSKLKQQAYQAGKRRNWPEAIAIYEQILELDKNNPTSINELGDICLKNGQIEVAMRHFLAAASKYKATGLLNNAVAVYKKVLRHDEENLNAHWFLAEVRASQGLMVEGQRHAEHFLQAAEQVSGEFKEIFLKRCNQLLGLYPESESVLERLLRAFRHWNLKLEEARAGCLLACRMYRTGAAAEARDRVAKLVGDCPEITNYSEYSRWQQLTGEAPAPESFADVNSIDLGDRAPAAAPASVTPGDAEPSAPGADASVATSSPFDELMAGVSELDGPDDEAEELPAAPRDGAGADDGEVDDHDEDDVAADDDPEGCITIDVDDDGSSLEDLVAQAAESVSRPAAPAVPQAGAEGDADASGKVVDLLQEILAEGGADLAAGEAAQLDTIAAEIGSRVGGDDGPQDAEDLYQQGLVYLDMGLYEQAATSFSEAALNQDYALRACEMGGIALLKAGSPEAALTVLGQGLEIEGAAPRETLGLLYHAGRALESLGRTDEAHERYARAHAIDPGFLDVSRRVNATVS